MSNHMKKRAFLVGFFEYCRDNRITAIGDCVKVASNMEHAATKSAGAPEILGRGLGAALGGLTKWHALGLIGAPALLGAGTGFGLAKVHNKLQQEELEEARQRALVKAFENKAHDAKLKHRLRELQNKHPGQYFQLM